VCVRVCVCECVYDLSLCQFARVCVYMPTEPI
jgi:hypothetical protein